MSCRKSAFNSRASYVTVFLPGCIGSCSRGASTWAVTSRPFTTSVHASVHTVYRNSILYQADNKYFTKEKKQWNVTTHFPCSLVFFTFSFFLFLIFVKMSCQVSIILMWIRPRRQSHRHSGMANLPSVGAIHISVDWGICCVFCYMCAIIVFFCYLYKFLQYFDTVGWVFCRGVNPAWDRGTRPPKFPLGVTSIALSPKVEWRYQSRGTRVGHVPLFSTLDLPFDSKFAAL